MNGKPVHAIPAKTVLNMESGFSHKLLCDGPTFSTGTACTYSCAFCYVPDMMRKQQPYLQSHGITDRHENVVIRREGALATLLRQLTFADGKPRYLSPDDRRVIYSSPLVDVAGNMELVRETVEACKLILSLTNWDIRLLSKSNLLPKVAEALESFTPPASSHLPSPRSPRERIIYGVSTGTLDDQLAQAFEQGAPKVSKRLESLHWLQDHGYRTFGMICPSLPVSDYNKFAREMAVALRAERCEHIWGEVINVRGDSYTRTFEALKSGGYTAEANWLQFIFSTRERWETYARSTFLAHVSAGYKPGQLRFLQYVTKESRPWWEAQQSNGAILL
jgi:DNA repair photolyase